MAEVQRVESLVFACFADVLDVMDEPSILLFSLGRTDFLHERIDEVARKLHGAAASADSLINHLQKLMPRSSPRWKERIREFQNEPVVAFLLRLRNYVLHHRLTLPLASMQLSGPGEHSFWLDSTVLRSEFAGRGANPRPEVVAYMESCGDRIDLEETVGKYLNEVQGLIGDCLETLREEAPDMDGYQDLASAVVSLDLRDRTESLRHVRDRTVTASHQFFSGILPIGVIEELEAAGCVADRAEMAILELTNRWEISSKAADVVHDFVREESISLSPPRLRFELGEMDGRAIVALVAVNDCSFGWTIREAGVGAVCLRQEGLYVPPQSILPIFPIGEREWKEVLPTDEALRPWVDVIDVGILFGLWQTCSYENGVLTMETTEPRTSSRIEVIVSSL